jgi:hypothetical protein
MISLPAGFDYMAFMNTVFMIAVPFVFVALALVSYRIIKKSLS